MSQVFLVAHNVRSIHNVGSMLRTAEGLGVNHVYLTGYTPYPEQTNDGRLPHLAGKITRQIHKTALGAENIVSWSYEKEVLAVIASLKNQGVLVAALEQSETSQPLNTFSPPNKIALVVGREVEGIEQEVLEACDTTLEIPMFGKKESFNVSVATAIALYVCRFK